MEGSDRLTGDPSPPRADLGASLEPTGAWAELCDSPEPAAFMEAWYKDPAMRQDPASQARHAELTERASVCSFCGVGCPYTVLPGAHGRDKLLPLSPLGLCVKGATSLLTGGDLQRASRLERHGVADDRIRAPMIRGHDGELVEVSWEQALDRAAWLFLHTREWVGFQAPAVYGNGQKTLETIWLACLYKLVFRLPTIGANSEHCLASAGAAHEQSFGNEASFTWQGFDELERCDVAILHGTNPYVTFPQAYYKLKRNRDAIKVVIDPVENDTALDLKATDPEHTLHIRFEQGGDVLFNLAVARVILEEGWHDADFLGRAVDPASLDAFRALVFEDRCHPDAVAAQICLGGDDPAALAGTIRRYAALLARPRADGERPRPAFVSSMGINQSTGSYGFSTNLNLLLLTGNVGREGAGSLRIAGQSNATSELMMGLNSRRIAFNLNPRDEAHRRQLAEALDLPLDNIPDGEGTPVSHMADDDYLYCFIFIGTQMTRNMPRLGHWTRRLGRAFNIVIDPFLVDGARDHADVVLPSLTYTERLGVIQRGDRTLQLQQPVTRAPEKAWSDEKILIHLALAIARRLRDPDTAALNRLDPDVVDRTFRRYLKEDGEVDVAALFDHVVEMSGALATFVQRYQGDPAYRREAAALLQGLDPEARDRLLTCLLPLLRKLDLHLALVDLLSDVVGPLPMRDAEGRVTHATVKGAHQCAVLELKEEVVAVQLFIAIKRGVERLFGEGAVVPRDDLAFVSGIAIPCAGDVPAYAMGIAPSELGCGHLLHNRSIGVHALLVVDRRRDRAVLVNIDTGVLPKDKELMKLRSRVIMKKQAATRRDHRRFFDRLGELMAIYVRLGDGNFTFRGPFDLPWAEFQEKLTFVPAQRKEFQAHLRDVAPSPRLVHGLIALGMLDQTRDADLITTLLDGCPADGAAPTLASALARLLADPAVPTGQKVAEVIQQFVAPVLDNDGGKIDLLGFDEAEGEVTVRFVGSCANCPYSMLSMETLVKPALLNVPGVVKVTHRGRLRTSDDRLTTDAEPSTGVRPGRITAALRPTEAAQE